MKSQEEQDLKLLRAAFWIVAAMGAIVILAHVGVSL